MIAEDKVIQPKAHFMEDLTKGSKLLQNNNVTTVKYLSLFNSSAPTNSIVSECQNPSTITHPSENNFEVIENEVDDKLSYLASLSEDTECSLNEFNATDVNDVSVFTEGAQYETVMLKKSDGNHIGPKYIAEKLTVVNNLINDKRENVHTTNGQLKQRSLNMICCFIFVVLIFLLLLYFLIHLNIYEYTQINYPFSHNNKGASVTNKNSTALLYMLPTHHNKTLDEPDYRSKKIKKVKRVKRPHKKVKKKLIPKLSHPVAKPPE